MRARRTTVAVAASAVLGLALVAPTTAATAADGDDAGLAATQQIRDAVTPQRLRGHLRQLEAAAKRYGDRAAGTEGYNAAARYLEFELREAGYRPTRQYFDFEYEEVQANEVTVAGAAVTAIPMTYSPSTPAGGVTSTLTTPTDPLGCTADAYGPEVAGTVVLVSRGTCAFGEKAAAAAAAGAAAAIIYNNEDGDLNGTLGDPAGTYAPTLGVTQAVGRDLLTKVGSPATVNLQVLRETRRTFNVIAETPGGDEDNVVMVGAHLDGVEGVVAANDNGTGTAAVLETAIQLPKHEGLRNKVRFAFWGAEELGLIGSTEYVNDLVENDPTALDDIATYLNFDMLGSPNWVTSVYDADQSTYTAPVPVPAGSIETEQAFRDYFDAMGQPVVDTEFSGRSDYQAFIVNGVAAGGVFSGADGTKTAEEQRLFGGIQGVAYDPNYHTPADDLTNVRNRPLHIHSDAVAHLTLTLARSTRVIDVPNPSLRSAAAKKKVAYGLPDGVEAR